MKIPQVHNLSRASQLSLLAVVILLGAVFFTVNNALQQQNSASKASTATNTIGNTSIGAVQDSGDMNCFNGLKVTAPSTGGTLQSVTVYISNAKASPNNKYAIGIYSDNSGHPASLLTQSSTGTLVTGWNTIPVSYLLAPSKSYWLMYNTNGDNNVPYNNQNTPNNGAYLCPIYLGSLPSTIGGATIDAAQYSIYATLASTASPTSTPVLPTSTPVPPVPTGTSGSTTGNFITNPSFENSTTDWYFNHFSPAVGSLSVTSSQAEDGAHSAQVAVTTTDSTNWHIQLSHDGLPMVAGHTYTLSFWAKAAANRTLQVIIQQIGGSNDDYSDHTYNLTTSWQRFSFTYTPTISQSTVAVRFEGANYASTFWIDNVEYDTGSTPVPTAIPTVHPTSTPVPTAIPTVHPTPTCGPPPECIKNGVNICMVPVNGWCGFGTPTPVPPTAAPTGIPTHFPTAVPTIRPTSTPTAIPLPTDTPVPGSTVIAVNVGLHGVGLGGDSANPGSLGNMSPLRPSRTITADIYDTQNQLVMSQQGSVNFDGASGRFKGTVDLGTGFATGLYTVKIKSDQYLRGLVPGIQSITVGTTNTLPAVTLVAGDINGDNAINIVDYNLLIGCYSDLLPATDCTATNNVLADLTDDGHVNQFDYNLFLRELTNIGGQ